MIRHFVMMRFREDVSSETKAEIYAGLDRLRERLPGMVAFHAGQNVSPETPVIHGNHDAFWVDFADAAARDAYIVDEEHQKLGARIVALTKGGPEGVTVVDLEF